MSFVDARLSPQSCGTKVLRFIYLLLSLSLPIAISGRLIYLSIIYLSRLVWTVCNTVRRIIRFTIDRSKNTDRERERDTAERGWFILKRHIVPSRLDASHSVLSRSAWWASPLHLQSCGSATVSGRNGCEVNFKAIHALVPFWALPPVLLQLLKFHLNLQYGYGGMGWESKCYNATKMSECASFNWDLHSFSKPQLLDRIYGVDLKGNRPVCMSPISIPFQGHRAVQ